MNRLITALAASAIVVAACSTAPSTNLPGTNPPASSQPASTSSGTGVAPTIADITTYKGGMDRLGVHPGPGPATEPVVLWQMDLTSGPIAAPLLVDGDVLVIGEDGSVRAIGVSNIWIKGFCNP